MNAPVNVENPNINSSRKNFYILRCFDDLAAWLASHPWALLPVLVVLYLHIILQTRTKNLWHDEIFTYYIAQAPTFMQMLQWTRQIDLNPPLYYISARACFHLFHPSSFAVRLPSMIGYFIAVICAYLFMRCRLGPLYGMIAALIVMSAGFNGYAYEARPYAMVLGFLGIAAIGWQGATEEDKTGRWLDFVLLGIGGFGMLLSHVLALVAYGAFFFAEAIRLAIRRKADWPLWLILIVPLPSCILYFPLIQSHGVSVFPYSFQAPHQLLNAYSPLWANVDSLLAITMILFASINKKPSLSACLTNRFQLFWPDVALASGLLLVPLEITLVFMRLHSAFFPRYGMPSLLGVAILVPYWLGWWTNASRRAALIGAVVFIFGVLPPAAIVQDLRHSMKLKNTDTALSGEVAIPLTKIHSDLPFVDASGLTFLEMNTRENAGFLSRVYYLEDKQADIQYAHATIFEIFPALIGKFPISANIASYHAFIEQHPRFIVLGTYNYPEDWLLRKLLADGATLRFLGNFPNSYKDHELYEVTMKP